MSIDRGSADEGLNTRSLVIAVLAIVLVSAVAAAVLWWAWPELPERVATHWDGSGQPDAYTDRSAGLALMLVGLPAAVSVALALATGFVPQSAPGSRWVSALPVGLAAGMLTLTTGSTVQQRDGGEATIGPLILTMLVIGGLATAAVAALLPSTRLDDAAGPPPPDAPRLADGGRAWWTGTARVSPLLVGGLLALLLGSATLITLAVGLGWILAVLLLVPALLIVAHSRFRITIGDDRVVASGALAGWPRISVPLATVAAAGTRPVSVREFGGIGLRYRRRSSGVITRSGTALVLTRSDASEVVVTCDDAEAAAATVNSLRSQAEG